MAMIPQEYQEVEYIGTTGTQFADVNYTPVDGDEFSLDFAFTEFPSTANNFSCLVATKNEDPQFQMVFGPRSGFRTIYYKYFSTGEAAWRNLDIEIGTIYHAQINASGVLNLAGQNISPANNSGYATGPLRLFARSTGGIYFKGRLLNFSVKNNGREKLNLVPCYRKSDNEPGIYDTVSETFITNAGTGDFVVGPDVTRESLSMLWLRRRLMGALESIKKLIVTAANGIVSFVTNQAMPTTITCEFSPVQSGTGDPSPSNVRPISGWTGCEITQAGKNLLNLSTLITRGSGVATTYWSEIKCPTGSRLVWTFEDNDTSVTLPSNASMLLRTNIGSTTSAYKYLIQNGELKSDANGFTSDLYLVVNWMPGGTSSANIEKIFQRYKIMCRIEGQGDATYEPFSLNLLYPSATRGAMSPETQGYSATRVLEDGKLYIALDSTGYYRPNNVSNVSINNGKYGFTATGSTYGIGFAVDGLTPGETYTATADGTNFQVAVGFTDSSDNWLTNLSIRDVVRTFTVPNNAAHALIVFSCITTNTQVTFYNARLYKGSSDKPYTPYNGKAASIRWTGNLIDFYSAYNGKSGITMAGNDANGYTISGLASAVRNAATVAIPAELSGKTLQFSATLSPMENGNLSYVITNTANGTVRTEAIKTGETGRVTTTFVATATTKIQMDYGSGDKQCSVSNIMLGEAGQVDYLPYGMGGVYGGTLTINEDGTGTLVADLAMVTFDGSNDEGWGIETAIGGKNFYVSRPTGMTTATSQDAVSGMLSNRIPIYGYSIRMDSQDMIGHIVVTNGYINYPISTLISIDNLPDFLTWLVSNNLQLTYKLATPATYNLTASQVNSIIGANNIWHDMNGSITVEYYNKQ